MSETLTRTITESLMHEDVQRAILDLVAKRNPGFKPLPDDAITFTRKWSPPQPVMPPGVVASPISLDVDVKVVQEVKPAKVFMESTPRTNNPYPSLWAQQFGKRAFTVEMLTGSKDFEMRLRDLRVTAGLLLEKTTNDEARRYFAEVIDVLSRDIATVSAR